MVKVDRVVADLVGTTAEGFQVGVLLFATDGKLSCLEVYDLNGLDKMGRSLPIVASLHPFGS